MNSKISIRQKLALVLAIVVSVICLTWLTTSLINNAFAEEAQDNQEPQTETQSNNPIQISFNIEGLDEGVVPHYTLTSWFEPVEYTLGDKLTLNLDSCNVTYSIEEEGSLTIEGDGDEDSYLYTFTCNCFGYDIVGFEPADKPEEITQNTNFLFKLKKTTDPYNIMVYVQNPTDFKPMPGVKVSFYDLNYRLIAGPTFSKKDGYAELNNIPISDVSGFIVLQGDNIIDRVIKTHDYEYVGHMYFAATMMPDVSEADVVLDSNDSLHNYFYIETETGKIDDPESKVIDEVYYKFEKLAVRLNIAFFDNSYITIKQDSSVEIYSPRPDGKYSKAYINAVGQEGYYAKSWMVDIGQNEAQPLNPGDTATIPKGYKFNAYPIYDVIPPQPGPEPTPTPGEEVNAVPQTGDRAPLVPFALLAVLAGGVLLYTRKASQK